MFRSLTLGDRLLLALTIVAAGSSFSLVNQFSPEGDTVVVEVDGIPVFRTTLREDSEFSVSGMRGDLILRVEGGGVRVVRAECPNRICVRTGSRTRTGDLIVCVPNKVVVRIGAGRPRRVGGVTG
jgi:hypothetical protein